MLRREGQTIFLALVENHFHHLRARRHGTTVLGQLIHRDVCLGRSTVAGHGRNDHTVALRVRSCDIGSHSSDASDIGMEYTRRAVDGDTGNDLLGNAVVLFWVETGTLREARFTTGNLYPVVSLNKVSIRSVHQFVVCTLSKLWCVVGMVLIRRVKLGIVFHEIGFQHAVFQGSNGLTQCIDLIIICTFPALEQVAFLGEVGCFGQCVGLAVVNRDALRQLSHNVLIVEDIANGDGRRNGVGFGLGLRGLILALVDAAISNAIEIHLQLGIATGGHLSSIRRVIGIEPFLRLVTVGQTVTIGVHDVFLATAQSKVRIVTELRVVLREGDVRGRVNDTILIGQRSTMILRVANAGSLFE